MPAKVSGLILTRLLCPVACAPGASVKGGRWIYGSAHLTLGQRLVGGEVVLPTPPFPPSADSLLIACCCFSQGTCQADALFWVLLGCGREHGGVQREACWGEMGSVAPGVCTDSKTLPIWLLKCKHRVCFQHHRLYQAGWGSPTGL